MKGLYRYAVLVAVLACAAPTSPVQAQAPESECTQRILNRADTMYNLGRRDSTIAWLTPCLVQEGFSEKEDEVAAYRLVALSYFANQEPEPAKDWIRRLVRTHRDYAVNPDQDPLFFQEWIERYRPKKWYQKTWVRGAGVAAIGGVAGYFLLKPAASPSPLPLAPGFPVFSN